LQAQPLGSFEVRTNSNAAPDFVPDLLHRAKRRRAVCVDLTAQSRTTGVASVFD